LGEVDNYDSAFCSVILLAEGSSILELF